MGTTFREADDVIQKMVLGAIEKYHKETLAKNGVRVNVLIASRESKKLGVIPALREKGIDVQATIQVTSLKDRARGQADANLVIDEYNWDRIANGRREALIDHMLEHLEIGSTKPTKKNAFATGTKFDDLGRPCLRIRPYDWRIVGFEKTAERHGEASVEARMFNAFSEEYGQLLLFDPARFTKAVADRSLFSKPCQQRKHAKCKADTCTCPCHGKTATVPEGNTEERPPDGELN